METSQLGKSPFHRLPRETAPIINLTQFNKRKRQMKLLLNSLIFGFLVISATVQANEIYSIDNAHASVGFSISHLVISKVKGNFNDFSGTFVLDKANRLIEVDASIKTASIDTGVKKRDDHLRSADFFEVEKYPEITFTGKKVLKRNGKHILLGKLTMHGVTKNIEIPYTIKGPITDPYGNKKIGFHAETVINRTDYGLNWNQALEAGGVMVGEEVQIEIDLEAVKK